jgi:hypothetical protein
VLFGFIPPPVIAIGGVFSVGLFAYVAYAIFVVSLQVKICYPTGHIATMPFTTEGFGGTTRSGTAS